MEVTDKVRDILTVVLKDQIEDKYLRLFVSGFGCTKPQIGMNVEMPKEGDHLLEVNSVKLAIEQEVTPFLDELIVDFDDRLRQLVILGYDECEDCN